MKKLTLLVGASTALLLALLSYSFHTDIVTRPAIQDRYFLISWSATERARQAFIESFARGYYVAPSTYKTLSPSYKRASDAHFEKYCDWNRAKRTAGGINIGNVCTRKFTWSGTKWITRTIPGSTYAQGKLRAEAYLRQFPLTSGIAPSRNISQHEKVSQSTMSRALWLGLALPLLLLALFILMVAWALSPQLQRYGPNKSCMDSPVKPPLP